MAYVFIDKNGNYTDPPPGFDFQTGAINGVRPVRVILDDDAGDSNEYVRGDIIPDTTGAERP